MKFVAAKCPSCNGELQIPDNKDFVKCMYCGVDIRVREVIKVVIDGNVPNLLKLGNEALKTKNYAEAYNYFNKVLEFDVNNSQAWFGKAVSYGFLHQKKDINEAEILTAFEKCLEYSDSEDIASLKSTIACELNYICHNYYTTITTNYKTLSIKGKNKMLQYFENCKQLITMLEKAVTYSPQNIEILTFLDQITPEIIKNIQYQLEFKEYGDYLKKRSNEYKEKLMVLDINYKNRQEQITFKNKNLKHNQIKFKGGYIGMLIFFLVGISFGLLIAIEELDLFFRIKSFVDIIAFGLVFSVFGFIPGYTLAFRIKNKKQ
ncbi:MAG: hypothetical protein JSS63_09495 [Bacteroidetes bacterium]|nr:hypothetical protein [Bacteroidota bacterium]